MRNQVAASKSGRHKERHVRPIAAHRRRGFIIIISRRVYAKKSKGKRVREKEWEEKGRIYKRRRIGIVPRQREQKQAEVAWERPRRSLHSYKAPPY